MRIRRNRFSNASHDSLRTTLSSPVTPVATAQETIGLDDICAICHLLLYKPVTTKCNHVLCGYCMAQWTDASINTQLTRVGLDETTLTVLPHEIETRCPMCRTSTTSALDAARATELRTKYPQTYHERETEALDDNRSAEDGQSESVDMLTIYIGNTHAEVRQDDQDENERYARNKHSWKFFVRPSRTDLIEEVQVFLHPTFRTSRVIIQLPPYELRRLGWGYFTITACLVLKAGYSWVSSEAEDTADGGVKGRLPLQWTLDFNGRGSQGRCLLKFKREKRGDEVDELERRERNEVRRLWAQQREADPDWIDDDDSNN